MKKTVYIETSIPSFYHEVRAQPEMVVLRKWTRKWWDSHSHQYALVTGQAVIDELRRGAHPKQEEALDLIREVRIIPFEKPVAEIVDAYFRHHLMPRDPAGDALHLALASYHKCDFLLTWNCNHLANANKFEHIRRINSMLGLFIPLLVTPLELLGKGD